MKINIQHIIEGWRNHIIPPERLKKAILQNSVERLLICKKCEFNSRNTRSLRPDEHCTICGCPLIALTKCLSCNCSIENEPKWEAIITPEEEEKIYEE